MLLLVNDIRINAVEQENKLQKAERSSCQQTKCIKIKEVIDAQ